MALLLPTGVLIYLNRTTPYGEDVVQ